MYSMVLVAALASSPMTPDCHRGGCHGCSGCYGCYGGCYGGCHGCYGGGYYGCTGGCYGCGGGYVQPKQMPGEKLPPPKEKEKKGAEETALNRARLIVELPANARLFIDDQPTSSMAAQRTFLTPPLDPNKSYVYSVRAELVRDGQTISETKEVGVTAGGVSQLSFNDLRRATGGRAVPTAGR
jgi:uncharacterized protein (TIGR03000 family)